MGKRSFQEAHGCPVAAQAASGGCARSQPGPGERASPTDRLRLSAPRARPRDRRPEAARGRSGCGPSAAMGAGVPGAGRASGAGSSRSAAGEGHEPSGSLSPHCSRLRSRTGPASSRWAGGGWEPAELGDWRRTPRSQQGRGCPSHRPPTWHLRILPHLVPR